MPTVNNPVFNELDPIDLPPGKGLVDVSGFFVDNPGVYISPMFRDLVLPALSSVTDPPNARIAVASIVGRANDLERQKAFLGDHPSYLKGHHIVRLLQLQPYGTKGGLIDNGCLNACDMEIKGHAIVVSISVGTGPRNSEDPILRWCLSAHRFGCRILDNGCRTLALM